MVVLCQQPRLLRRNYFFGTAARGVECFGLLRSLPVIGRVKLADGQKIDFAAIQAVATAY